MIFVCWPQILAKEPSSVRRHVIHRIKLVAHKGRRHETDTFLRKLCPDGVHVAKRGRQPIEAITTANCPLNSSSLIITSRWGWRHDFPCQGNSVLGIQGEQGVQQSGAAAWQTNDKERFANSLFRDARVRLSIALHEQTGTQYAYKIGPKDYSSD